MSAAIEHVRSLLPREIIVAVHALRESLECIRAQCEDVVVLHAPSQFGDIAAYYNNFSPVDDCEVVARLRDFAPASLSRGLLAAGI